MINIKEWTVNHFNQYARVWRLIKKPSRKEFQTIAKVSALGLLLIGAIGFAINVFLTLMK